jgi:hypothetical protein
VVLSETRVFTLVTVEGGNWCLRLSMPVGNSGLVTGFETRRGQRGWLAATGVFPSGVT